MSTTTTNGSNPTPGATIDAPAPTIDAQATPLVCVLSPPRSFSTVVCAMLGQHPELYGLAETHLLTVTTVEEWWQRSAEAQFPMTHGLLRSTAELVFGEQSTASIQSAASWLRARSGWSSAELLAVLAERVRPRTLVEKSPVVVFREEWMSRVADAFPNARFIHLTRHPRGQALSVEKHVHKSLRVGPMPVWLRNLGWSDGGGTTFRDDFDPQHSWYALNSNVDRFVSSLPEGRWVRVRGEDVVSDPWSTLGALASWLGIRTDAEAIEAMLHPERSPFAGFGPPGARFGNDIFFLCDARLQSDRARRENLDDPLEWRSDGAGFAPEVVTLAQRFGYE